MSASETSQPPADPSDTAITTVRGFGITFSTTAVIALLTIFAILLWKIRSFFHDDALIIQVCTQFGRTRLTGLELGRIRRRIHQLVAHLVGDAADHGRYRPDVGRTVH